MPNITFSDVPREPGSLGPKGFPYFRTGRIAALVAAGLLFIAWTVVRVDREMRLEILREARLVAQALEVGHVRSLTGTQADFFSPNYRALRERLSAVRAANPRCRFVYLLSQRAGGVRDGAAGTKPGEIVFLADSEPEESPSYSPPGQLLDEVSEEVRQVFAAKTALVEGPVSDRWGLWISALAPVTESHGGAVAAVLGMDVDARYWEWDVAARAALPVGLTCMLVIGLAARIFAREPRRQRVGRARGGSAVPGPVLLRLLPPLAALFVVLLAFMGLILYHQHVLSLDRELAADMSDLQRDLHEMQEQQIVGLETALRAAVSDLGLRRALASRDTAQLKATVLPLYGSLRREIRLSHLYCMDLNRVCLLRAHLPERAGDVIERFTAVEAERTGRFSGGLELGVFGTLSVRAVHPVELEGRRVGYLEMGKTFEELLSAVHLRSCVRLAVALRKDRLSRSNWEEGMRLLGRVPEWERLSRCVISYDSLGRLPNDFARVADEWAGTEAHDKRFKDVELGGRRWRVAPCPLRDVEGAEIGDLLVARDLTSEVKGFANLMRLGGMAGGVLLALVLGVTYVLLRNTDAGISAQQETLRQSEERFAQLAEQGRTVAWEVDAEGLYTYVSRAAEAVFGWRPEELVGNRRFFELRSEEGRAAFKQAAFEAFGRKAAFRDRVSAVLRKDGRRLWVTTSGLPLVGADGKLRGYRGSDMDVTERKNAEDALRASAVELRAMALRLQSVREEERTALARELHDSLAQQLTALTLHVELLGMECAPLAARSPEMAAFYDSVVSMVPHVERLTERMQKIIASLRPAILNELGLVAAIEWLVEETCRTGSLQSRLALPEGEVTMAPEVALALYRIAQEALGNVARHAQATRVVVALRAVASGWELEVCDDGKGFDPAALPSGASMGLLAMRERIGAFGGTVVVESAPGRGTRVRVRTFGGGRDPQSGESDASAPCG